MTFTVMISTRDRCHELERTCLKLRELKPPPQQVIICADGCQDETLPMLRARFAEFTVIENSIPRGSVYSRDRMLRLASGDIVVSLDDDSYPVRRDFLQRLSQIFLEHPEAAVIVFPELRGENTFAAADKTDVSHGHYVSAYANCAAAMRREFYWHRPGFVAFFCHMYEEADYALQCYAAGASVWFEPTLTVRHRVSEVNRQPIKRHHLNARNELWSVWLRCPMPWLFVVSGYRVLREFIYACSKGTPWALREPLWWVSAARGLCRCYQARQTVSWATYYSWVKLARNPIYSVRELRQAFPELGSQPSPECRLVPEYVGGSAK